MIDVYTCVRVSRSPLFVTIGRVHNERMDGIMTMKEFIGNNKVINDLKKRSGKVIACQEGIGWRHVQLDDITKMQKSWEWEGRTYRVDVFFGTLRNGSFTPVVITNVYEQGAGSKMVVDDNCDVWKNMFTSTNKDEGNEYFKYLLKHGFKKVEFCQ